MTLDMLERAKRPYFFWDEDITIDEFVAILRTGENWNRLRLLGKMLREARDIDVWHFVTPEEVAEALPELGRQIGRRRTFWEFLIQSWKDHGLLRQ